MKTIKTGGAYLTVIFLTWLLFFAMLIPVQAGTVVYNDYGIRRSDNGLSSTIDITLTGAAADAGAGGSLISYDILHLDEIIEAQLQLVEVELVPGTEAAEPAAVTVSILDASTIKWGPQTIDNTTADTSPGSVYGGHDKWGVFPICDRQWKLTVGDIGTANTLRIRLKFK